MSTTINVTVDDGGLPARNRQQTAANRQAFVQGQASQQAAQQGVDQRAADRRAAGLDPATGRPLASAGASSRLPRINQEPAANRRGGLPYVLLVPSADYQDYGGTLTGFVERARNAKDVRFSRFAPNDSNIYRWGRDLQQGLFVAGGGPNGSNCLETTGEDSMYTGLAYAVVDQDQYDSIYNGFFYRDYPLELWINDEVVHPTSKVKLSDCPGYTVEVFMRFGNDTLGAGTQVLSDFFGSGDHRDFEFGLNFGGLYITLGLRPTATRLRDSGTGPWEWVIGDKLRIERFEILGQPSFNEATSENLLVPGLTLINQTGGYLKITAENPSNADGTEDDTFYPDGFLPNTWHHMAIVRTSGGLHSIYFDGVAICGGLTVKEQWNEIEGAAPITGDILLDVDTSVFSTMPGPLHPAIHGYRFTPKARYSGNFTPPPSITSFT